MKTSKTLKYLRGFVSGSNFDLVFYRNVIKR